MALSDKIIRALDLVLDASEAVELRKIDEAIRQEPYTNPIYILLRDDVYRDYLVKRREKTVDVYRLRSEARVILNHAIASVDNQAKWDEAYRIAQTAASAEQLLFNLRMDEVKVQLELFRCGITVIRALSIAWLMLSNANNVQYKLSLGEIFLVSKLIKALSLCILLAEPSSYDVIEAVLDAANSAGIRLDINIGERLADSGSLICHLINIENNAEKSVKLGVVQIPDEFLCPITLDVMTDPVANIHSQHRFERTAILEWLQQKATNPSTTLPLCSDDLRRDFELKRKIDAFIEHGCQNKTSQLSIFKPKSKPLPECVDLDIEDEISEHMMAESAFGQGSHACLK
tara:strand:- start:16479 stop:17513 length:1035 start_codon:yes stop_codon:yes gene_type:complete